MENGTVYADPEVSRAVQEWLSVCAPHLDFKQCVCKGSRPALPIHHTTVVLRCSYPAAVHRPSTGVYIYLGGHHWTWGYNHSSVLVIKVRRQVYNLTNGFGSFVLILRVCVCRRFWYTVQLRCCTPLLTEYTIPPWLGTNL